MVSINGKCEIPHWLIGALATIALAIVSAAFFLGNALSQPAAISSRLDGALILQSQIIARVERLEIAANSNTVSITDVKERLDGILQQLHDLRELIEKQSEYKHPVAPP